MRKKKKLILLLNVKGAYASWQISAHLKHVAEGIEPYLKPYELIMFPVMDQPTALYWLDGDVGNPKDIKSFEEIKEAVRPVLNITLKECLEIKPTSLAIPQTAQEKMQEVLMKGMSELEDKNEKTQPNTQN